MQSQKGFEALQKVKAAVEARGAKTIRSLGKVFRAMDSFDGNRKVDRSEFAVALREIGVSIAKADEDALFALLDVNRDGTIDFEEFLVGIRGRPNQRRMAIIDKAFLKFDKDCSGVINAKDLRGVYNARAHPKVQAGRMTEDEVFLEFLANFGDVNKDGSLTRDEWNDYYAAVSASVDNDDHFIELMKNAWKLD
eukprot:TRINITY_DN8164_c0_g1_i2.p1 TRINITY_DN8164_c0_g1~~TRINITY_DN8164_c0_g1_i2.p1  ORF type:complete len:194 (-),score=74.01 TRINITY_DN8164_c0_g1_i2:152-733(-)